MNVAIIGAGPAGLTAGHELSKAGFGVIIFEADKKYVGGISRTEEYKGFHFDIGGHRFFSKSKEVEDFWTSILATILGTLLPPLLLPNIPFKSINPI